MTENDAESDPSYDLVDSFDFLVKNRAGFLVPLFNVFDKTFIYSKAPTPLKDSPVQSGFFLELCEILSSCSGGDAYTRRVKT
jgi:hypothetical protein